MWSEKYVTLKPIYGGERKRKENKGKEGIRHDSNISLDIHGRVVFPEAEVSKQGEKHHLLMSWFFKKTYSEKFHDRVSSGYLLLPFHCLDLI